jgi:hypothetical protein
MKEPQGKSPQLFRPSVAPSRNGGLLLISYDGSRMVVPDDEVEALIEDMRSVRYAQAKADCFRIAGIDGGFQRIGGKA